MSAAALGIYKSEGILQFCALFQMVKGSRKNKSATTSSTATSATQTNNLTTATSATQRYVAAKKEAVWHYEEQIQEIKELLADSSGYGGLDLSFYSTVISTSLLRFLSPVVNLGINQEISNMVNQIHHLISIRFEVIRKTYITLRQPPTESSNQSETFKTWKKQCRLNTAELEKTIKKEFIDEMKEYDALRIRVLIVITKILLPGMLRVLRLNRNFSEFDKQIVGDMLGEWEEALKVGMSKAGMESAHASQKGEEDLRYEDFMLEFKKEEVIESRDGGGGDLEKDVAETMGKIKEYVIETRDEVEEERKKDLVEMMLAIGGLRISSFDDDLEELVDAHK